MKASFSGFPEIIFIDATYKLNELRMPLYIMLGEDSNGQSEIFATFIVANEERSTISKMVKIFKQNNPNWKKTVTIMSDKDFTERQVLAEEFPHSQLQICLFHVLRSMRREITAEKMGITGEERNLCLEIIQKMVYSQSEEQYQGLLESLKMTDIHSVIQYFESNWDVIHDEWVEGLKSTNLTFMNRTNNRLESLNQKIKVVCPRNASLSEFFDNFLTFLRSTRIAQDHKAITSMQKRPVILYEPHTTEGFYVKYLTPYAFTFVLQQLEMMSKVKDIEACKDGSFRIKTKAGLLKVTKTSCDCSFRSAMLLPCRHIFAIRSLIGDSLCDKSLCATRWSASYYRSKHHVAQSSIKESCEDANVIISADDSNNNALILSQSQKYRKAFQLCQKIASIVSESPMRQFEQKLSLLQSVYNSWNSNVEIGIQTLFSK